VAQRFVHQCGRDPAAGPRAGCALLKQDQTQRVEVVVVGGVVRRGNDLGQLVRRALDAHDIVDTQVRRHSACMTGVGQHVHDCPATAPSSLCA